MLLNGRDTQSKTEKTEKKHPFDHVEPAPMENLNWLIHLQHTRGEIKACKELINSEMDRSHRKNEYIFFKQGIIFKEEKNISEALETFQKCLKINQQNAIILKEVAYCLYEMRRYRLSLNAYLEVEQLYKNTDWQLFYFIAQIYVKLGNMEKAKEYAQKSIKVGKQEECYALLIKLLVSERDFRSAVVVSNTAVESCPDSVKLLTESGLIFIRIGQLQHAFERFSQALALEPSCSKALLGIGCITHRHQEYEVALSKYKIAVLYETESVALWNNIGMCFYAKQKYIAAISCLKRGLWISPLNWKLLFNLGLVHLSTNQPASGFNFVCSAVNLRPDMGETFALLAYTLFELKDIENALRAIKQACLLLPNDPTIIANTALFLEMAGLYEESQDFVQKFKGLGQEGQNISNEVSRLVENLVAIQTLRLSNMEIGKQVLEEENGIEKQIGVSEMMSEDEV